MIPRLKTGGPRRWPHVYELCSVNLKLLPQAEARAVLNNFAAMLNALTAPTELRIVEDRRVIALGDELYEISYKRFFAASEEPLEDALSLAGLKFVKVPEMPELKITADAPRFAVDSEGRFVRVHTLIGMTPSMTAGWLTDLYPYLHEIRIYLRPLENGRDLAVRHYRALAARIELRASEGRPVDPERAMELEAARRVAGPRADTSTPRLQSPGVLPRVLPGAPAGVLPFSTRDRKHGSIKLVSTRGMVLRPGFEPGSPAREAGILGRSILPERDIRGDRAI